MSNAIRLSGPCQAGTARINEPWKRGAIDSESFVIMKKVDCGVVTRPEVGG